MQQQWKRNVYPHTNVLNVNKHLNDKEQLICLYNNNNKKNKSICNEIKIIKKCYKLYVQTGARKRKETQKIALVKVINSNTK